MVHEDICPPQVYATSIFLLFKAFLALIWLEGTLGQAAQINVVVFYLATRGPSNRVRKAKICAFSAMSNNFDTSNGFMRGTKGQWVG